MAHSVEVADHILFLQKLNGERTKLLDSIGVPNGWVVDGKLGRDWWEKIQAQAIPLRPSDNLLDFFNGTAKEAQRLLVEKRHQYGDNTILLMVPDDEVMMDETEEGLGQPGWSARFVRLGDLDKTPEALLQEASQASRGGDYELTDMLRHAYLAVTGYTDTK